METSVREHPHSICLIRMTSCSVGLFSTRHFFPFSKQTNKQTNKKDETMGPASVACAGLGHVDLRGRDGGGGRRQQGLELAGEWVEERLEEGAWWRRRMAIPASAR